MTRLERIGDVAFHDDAAFFAARIPRTLFVRRTADATAVQSDDSVNADDTLIVPVEASSVYLVEARIIQNSGTTPDFKAGWTAPSGATMAWHVGTSLAAGAAVLAVSDTVTIDGAAADRAVEFRGTLVVSTTAGNLTFAWAQGTSTASDTKIIAGSYVKLTKVG